MHAIAILAIFNTLTCTMLRAMNKYLGLDIGKNKYFCTTNLTTKSLNQNNK